MIPDDVIQQSIAIQIVISDIRHPTVKPEAAPASESLDYCGRDLRAADIVSLNARVCARYTTLDNPGNDCCQVIQM